MEIDDFWRHLAERSGATLEKVCMRRNCPICEYWAEIVQFEDGHWGQRINLYE